MGVYWGNQVLLCRDPRDISCLITAMGVKICHPIRQNSKGTASCLKVPGSCIVVKQSPWKHDPLCVVCTSCADECTQAHRTFASLFGATFAVTHQFNVSFYTPDAAWWNPLPPSSLQLHSPPVPSVSHLQHHAAQNANATQSPVIGSFLQGKDGKALFSWPKGNFSKLNALMKCVWLLVS